MARTKTLKPSIIKTRSQSRTGTTSRTTAPAPVAVATTERPIDSVDPVAVTTGRTIAPSPADLFADRPKTGALKNPPPVAVPVPTGKQAPRDRDSDLDDDANKKPAAKPTKGRPKKVVAPKAIRKPRKPRTDPADDLVDPMANIHVGDATGVVTAGVIARAGGYDPVLANPEQDPEQPEPQPKKTRRTTRASRAHRAGHGDDDDDEDSYSTVGPVSK